MLRERPTLRELDACGIGFVADARNRPSREIVTAALDGLACVKHRGAVAADARTADGSGVLLPLSPALFGEGVGVAFLFVRGDDPRPAVEAALAEEGLELVGWREPPTVDDELGDTARATKPGMLQALFRPAAGEADERAAYRLRRRIEQLVDGTYVVSCSFRTVVYKGMAPAHRLRDFYPDLADERWEASFAIFHQRFATNTTPTWERAQPFRQLCHNGEINTIQGNQNRMRARAVLGTEAADLGPEELFRPVVDPGDVDSGRLDSAMELLVRGGRDARHALAMMIPEAWENPRDIDPDVRGFYRYHSALMEPWDGPAGVVFTDGRGVGAALDRNGLRPLRWTVCEDGLVAACSEAGAIDVSGHGTVQRGRLGPGQMIYVDPERGVMFDGEIKRWLAERQPYAKWAADGFLRLSRGNPVVEVPDDLDTRKGVFGLNQEEHAMVLRPMAAEAKDPVFSMGDDSPLPPWAGRPRMVHHYLKQRFAQVTNPPIDPLREQLVMSLRTLLGPRRPLLSEVPDAANLLTLRSFFLYPDGALQLFDGDRCPFLTVPLDATFPVADGAAGLRAAVDRLCDEAEQAVDGGAAILVIEDGNVGDERAPVPSLLATGAVHHRLVDRSLRSNTSLVVVSNDARDVHHIAALLGYGADAICPLLALYAVAEEADKSESDAGSPEAQSRYQAAVETGVMKIMSKMGISTVDSYRGAQIFEVLGLAEEVVDVCFRGTPNVTGGIGWEELGRDVLAQHESRDTKAPGYYRVRKRGEYHTNGDDVVRGINRLALVPTQGKADDEHLEMMTAAHLLQRALRGDSWELYLEFADMVNGRPPTELHDLLELCEADQPVSLDEVEPASEIAKRFSTGAMSHGALSKEAHETLAQAMNLIGGMSNCGEGGEDPARYLTRGQGRDDRNSRIKQIASGRFGVTPEYVAHADELNIKMAQGSKPGEGGQLPGHKVTEEIARLRHTQPGVGLISPPPHHDIYSIEDLAQLIYDLKQVNGAEVSVKLVAEDNVGTIAAGVVKALADVVQISGQNGGTGASPLSSIKHAGMPWETGLAETQQALVANGLRDRVRLRVDGGFKTGRDVTVAALLGADEYSFGAAAMMAEGCIMLRACHKDTCQPGVATQRPNLRAKFAGTPEGVAAYMLYIAEEVRGYLARLGVRRLDDAIGRVELLRQRTTGDPRIDATDLSLLLQPPIDADAPRRFVARAEIQSPRSELGDQLLADAFRPLWEGDEVDLEYPVCNSDRTIGAALGGAIALEYGELPPRGAARVRFHGAAGQSFGAFLTAGVSLELVGDANDYVGKGMGGGRIVIRPPEHDAGAPWLAGNTCLYGATGGELYVAGAVGERFAVRNSGATAVVEGAGDHCCEYMTGGTVVVLGTVGYNLGAGMTGGQAFVWEPKAERLMARLNSDLVEVVRPDAEDRTELRWLVERHAELTGSELAQKLLASWDERAEELWQVLPKDRVKRIEHTQTGRVAAQ